MRCRPIWAAEGAEEGFERKMDYWHETWDQVLELDPDFLEAYTKFAAVRHSRSDGDDEGEEPVRRASGTVTDLLPKVKELVYVAIDCTTMQLYVPGLKLHIRNAVWLGATPEEAMEVFELASLMGSAERDGWGRGAG
jgi:alkylhydroperoxidase/carboxymuconolactone decarboxylase family protein YurZ